VKDAKPEQEQVTRVGKQLLRGGRCGLCLQQAGIMQSNHSKVEQLNM